MDFIFEYVLAWWTVLLVGGSLTIGGLFIYCGAIEPAVQKLRKPKDR